VLPVAVFDGEVVHPEALRLSDFFSGYFFGAGLFETMRIAGQRPQFLARHIERLKRGLSAVSAISPPAARRLELDAIGADIEAGLTRCREVSGAHPGVAKVTVSDGHVLVTFRDASPVGAMDIDTLEGSYRAGDALLNHKTLSYLRQYRGLRSGLLFQNERGELCESPTANLFVAFKDHIATPPLSAPCLAGIIREVLLERGALGELRVREEPIPASSMGAATGACLTNSVALAIPVTSYLGRDLPGSRSLAALAREVLSSMA
jgi:branched-chain amino acid aminotransferase